MLDSWVVHILLYSVFGRDDVGMGGICEFAEKVGLLTKKHNAEVLGAYSRQLHAYARRFDIAGISRHLAAVTAVAGVFDISEEENNDGR